MSDSNIGKNIKNDYGLMLEQFKTELNFRLDDYIRFGSRKIGWKFIISDYAIKGEINRRETEFGLVPRPYFEDHIEFEPEVEKWLKGRILKILIGHNDFRSCKWSNLYVRHSKNGESIKGKFTEGKFDRGFPHNIFFEKPGVNDTIEICYCSKFIWFWWWFKPKWKKITGAIVGIIVFLFSLINYKLIFKFISWLFKLSNKS